MTRKTLPCHADPPEDDQMVVQLFKTGVGRDLDDVDLALEFDHDTGCWQSLGESGEAKLRDTEMETLVVLEDLGKARSHTISKTLGKDYANTRKIVASLWTAGKIKKEMIDGKACYFLPRSEEK